MSGSYNTRMVTVVITRTQSASGFPTTSVKDTDVIGASVSTINPLQSSVNAGEVATDGALLLAEVRKSPTSDALVDGDYVKIDNDYYRINGKSYADFRRKIIRFNLQLVSEVK